MAKAVAGLHVGAGLTLPLDAITQSIALLAVRRAGKSTAAAVIAEEMHAAGLPWVAIDPKGDWWGLRSSGDGNGPGLPVPIFGGLHGDMPLLPEAGKLVAELIVEENLTCVLDVSEFASKAAQMRFLTDLGERLFRLHGKHPQPRHVFLEEADDVIPQSPRADMARCVGAWTKLIKQGGSRGLGITIISQRSAVVSKDALTQTGTMIALRTTSPQDRKAIRGWVDYHAVAGEVVDSLPGLDDGEAWVCSPHWLGRHGQPAIQRIRFRQRATFDSGATPTMARARRPATLADIDLGALTERMTAVTEKAAQDDPAALKRRIAELQRKAAPAADVSHMTAEISSLRAQLSEAEARPAEQVEVPVLGPGDLAALEQAITALQGVAGSLEIALSRAVRPAPAPVKAAAPQVVLPPVPRFPVPGSAPVVSPDGSKPLGRAERKILAVLAQFPEGRTRIQLALLAVISSKSSGYANALGALRSAALINRGEPILITPEGLVAIGDQWEPLPTGEALTEHWMKLLGKAERTILRCLLDAVPAPLTRENLAIASGYSASSSGFANALGKLRSLDLINRGADIMADETFAREVLQRSVQ